MNALGASASAREGVSDDRFLCDLERGLFFVCDASGPTYGGYYAPFGVDPGIAALLAAFDAARGTTHERLVAALEQAHTTMREMHEAYERARAGRVGLEAARAAADAVRPTAWRGHDSLAHFGASITACAVSADAVVVAQVGVCHAYALRDTPLLLIRDGSVASMVEASGAEIEVDAALRHAPAVLLGVSEPKIDVLDLDPRSPMVLCTDGAWTCEDAVRDLFAARSNDEVQRILERACTETHDDATAVVLRF